MALYFIPEGFCPTCIAEVLKDQNSSAELLATQGISRPLAEDCMTKIKTIIEQKLWQLRETKLHRLLPLVTALSLPVITPDAIHAVQQGIRQIRIRNGAEIVLEKLSPGSGGPLTETTLATIRKTLNDQLTEIENSIFEVKADLDKKVGSIKIYYPHDPSSGARLAVDPNLIDSVLKECGISSYAFKKKCISFRLFRQDPPTHS